jgi:pimeloyl-ACP methyl ester carboxylesterase
VDIHVEDVGTGDPVVLAHAGVTDSRVWDLTVPALVEAGYRAIRYDAPGFGRSPMPAEPYSLVRLAIDVMDAAGVETAHWVGLSGGGATGVDLALAEPSRVRTLSLVAPGLSGYEWPPYERFDAMEAAYERRDTAGLAVEVLRRWGPMSLDAQGNVIDEHASRVLLEQADWFIGDVDYEVAEPSAVERLGEISVPTLIVLGDRDDYTITDIGNLYAAGIPGSRLVTLAGADHLLPLRVPGELNALLLEHFAAPAPNRPS